jgi:hypothetical protein
MTAFTRRTLVKGAAAAGVLTGSGLTDWAKAWAQASPFKPENGATLNLLRWRRFVEAEDAQFNKMVAAFTAGDGLQGQRLLGELRRRAAEGVRRRQYRHRPGPHLVALFGAAPVPAEVPRRHRRRRLSRQEVWRLGAAGGGLRQDRRQVDLDPGRGQRRLHQLPHLDDQGRRLQRGAAGHQGLPRALQGAEGEGHALRFPAGPRHRRRQCLRPLAALVARRGAGGREREDHHQFARDARRPALRQGAVGHVHPRHGGVERLQQQPRLPLRRNLADRQRHLHLRRGQGLAGRQAARDRGRHGPCLLADRPDRQAGRDPARLPDVRHDLFALSERLQGLHGLHP